LPTPQFPADPIGATGAQNTRTPARILVIEDETIVREAMANVLSLEGHQVTLASDGESGIELFKKEQFDIVFTDLGMSGLSGWEVTRALKGHNPDTPVIIVTGLGVTIGESEVESSGVDGVLSKPFYTTALLDLIQRVAAKGRRRPQPHAQTPSAGAPRPGRDRRRDP
jgi:CheY-like chemotaxis protein